MKEKITKYEIGLILKVLVGDKFGFANKNMAKIAECCFEGEDIYDRSRKLLHDEALRCHQLIIAAGIEREAEEEIEALKQAKSKQIRYTIRESERYVQHMRDKLLTFCEMQTPRRGVYKVVMKQLGKSKRNTYYVDGLNKLNAYHKVLGIIRKSGENVTNLYRPEDAIIELIEDYSDGYTSEVTNLLKKTKKNTKKIKCYEKK